MACQYLLSSCFLLSALLVLPGVLGLDYLASPGVMEPFKCSKQVRQCNAILYHMDTGIQEQQIASFYSVNTSQMKPITHRTRQDYLITVPCSCGDVNGTTAYFYDTPYRVNKGDTFVNVSARIFSGVTWKEANEEQQFIAGNVITLHLLCGCSESESTVVITYSVEQADTLSQIASYLSSTVEGIEDMNAGLLNQNSFIDIGWVLYVPAEVNGVPNPGTGNNAGTEPAAPNTNVSAPGGSSKMHWEIIVGLISAVGLLIFMLLTAAFVRRNRSKQDSIEDPKLATKTISTTKTSSMRSTAYMENKDDGKAFGSERAHVYSQQDVEEAADNFDISKKIGEGGYGSVYFGLLGGKEVAIKKMRSNKSKEFYAELKVLCKIHHINVVELYGYACGDDYLYLVYEYIRNGSLTDHLHNPLAKGHQQLSWTARAQIALDAAKGIEYIHDHTKARYVHRDIKTSNILLDGGLRAKVADFGLAKLMERTNDEELIATRLVGTPGYLPPECVKELQVTSKTDVFAFGVVLAELITGQRAIVRDNQEPGKMKSLISIITDVFKAQDPDSALEDIIDVNLHGEYPIEDIYKMAEIADWCLSEDPTNRPQMREVVTRLSQIMLSSVDWEASLGGRSQVFSGVFNGR